MATKYKRAGSGNWSADASWSTTSGGAADTVKPTAADDVRLDAASGDLTIDAAAVCRSLNCTGYTGTLTHAASIGLTIGDATAGASNIALKFVAGMTYTLGNITTSAISFISTSATVQTVDFAGKTTGDVTFNATSNGSWQYTGAHTCGSTATVTFTKGTLDINGQTCSWGNFLSDSGSTRSLTLGAASITITRDAYADSWKYTGSNATLSGASSTITFSGATAQMGGAVGTYGTVIFNCTVAKIGTWGAQTCENVTFNGAANKTCQFYISSNITVTGTLTITGNSPTNRLFVSSGTPGTSRTITAAAVSVDNTDFMDITGAGASSWDMHAGSVGDCGGNSMKALGSAAFTTAATQTWSGTSGGNWSENAWTSRVPLPQDDVVISSAFSASQTVTADMPRMGKSITLAGSTGTPTLALTSVTNTLYGSLTLISGMSLSQDRNLVFAGRSTFTITSAGKKFPSSGAGIIFTAPGGTYTLQDAFSSGGSMTHNNGAFNANGFNVTITSWNSSNANSGRTVTMGSGIWTLTSTAASNIWTLGNTGLTFSGASATIVIASASANTRVFDGASHTYGTLTYNVAGSTGQLTMFSSCTIGTLNFSDASNARSMLHTAGITITILNAYNVFGTSGKLMTVGSLTAASHTLSKASGVVSCDYLSISRSTAGGGAAWYAGANSTDGGNNSGWQFTTAPIAETPGNNGALLGMLNLNNLRLGRSIMQ